MFDKISETLGVEHAMVYDNETQLPVVAQEANDVVPVLEQNDLQKAEEDFEFARGKIREAIETASDAMDDMLELARASEHPRSFEVLANLANSVSSMSESLVKLHKETLKAQQKTTQVVNNNALVMSTSDVIQMIRAQANADK